MRQAMLNPYTVQVVIVLGIFKAGFLRNLVDVIMAPGLSLIAYVNISCVEQHGCMRENVFV